MDPKTGQPAVDHQELVAAQNNLLYIEDVPIFYWPTFATDLNDPSFFIRRMQVKDERRFRHGKSIPIGPPTSCWASRIAPWEPIGP